MPKAKPTDVDYAGLSRELSELMARLEQGEQGIDEAVTTYGRGLEIINLLEAHLKKAENRVSELKAEYSDDEA